MSRLIKTVATKILTPIAKIFNYFHKPLQRLWAHSCLQAKINTQLEPSVVVQNCPEIHGTGQITLGKKVDLYRDIYLETQEQGQILMGDEVVLSRGIHIVSYSCIKIGTGTMIGEYTSIRDANHKIVKDSLIRYAGHTSSPIVIGSNVWIGRGATILAGVKIGDNAIIGANAVVTKDVEPNTLVAGVPARFIKQY
ncbi:acyltransferase [Candidatus Halobeggiatoa sp. HSG11]|nr:acyltransferase [Candidatus Halobeggiatoa sp. HSG11]